jgi:hypothetical protein
MPNISYGKKLRDRTALLLRSIQDFDRQSLDEAVLDRLSQKIQSEHRDWQTESPKIVLLTTNAALVELSGLSTAQVREALTLLEQFVGCLKRDFKSQGREKIYAQLSLWSTDPELNLIHFRQEWDLRRQGQGLKPLEPDPQLPNSCETREDFRQANDHPPPDSAAAPRTHPPFSESEDEPNRSQEPEAGADPWDEVFDRVVGLLRDSLPHSPLFRLLTRFIGFDPQAHIKPIDRHNLLIRVEETWIHQYLPNSLSQQPLLLLELENQQSMLSQYRNILWENPQDFSRPTPLPASTRLIEHFNAIRPLRRLLILGAPGSGKTVALLELLTGLLEAAKTDANQPIPIVFNLSTYGLPPEGRDFVSWLVTQLEEQYSLNKSRGRRFIENQKLLLLLDGLDEVRPDLRSICIRRINEFLRTYECIECVICSRFTEYTTAFEKLQLEASLKLQPLTPDQAVEYLENLPRSLNLKGLVGAIRHHSDFQRLAETPLMLNVMAVAYQDLDINDLEHFETLEDHRRYLYDVLILRLLNRGRTVDGHWLPGTRSEAYLYSQQEILDWLIWLAKHMVDRDQTIFFIEQLQPDWLDTARQRRGYRLNSHALMGVVIGIISACHMTPMAGWHNTGASTLVFLPLLIICISGLVLSSGIFTSLRGNMPSMLAGFISASAYVAFFAVVAQPYLNVGPNNTYLSRLFPIFMDWMGIALFWAFMRNHIVVVHRVIWSWLSAFRFLGVSMAAHVGVYMPIRLLLLNEYRGDDWINLLYEPLLTLGFAVSFGGFALGSSPPAETITVPNQGIHKALRNAGLLALIIGPMGMLAAWRYAHGNPYEFVMLAVAIGLIAAMLGGQRSGQVLIQHLVLRVILWWNRCTPWNYSRFLDFAVQRMFLRRAGGGYLFMHRSFMEHLAEKAHF